jgi:hypothetical protein
MKKPNTVGSIVFVSHAYFYSDFFPVTGECSNEIVFETDCPN